MNRTGLNLPIPPIVLAEVRAAYEGNVPPKVIAAELGFAFAGRRIYTLARQHGWSKGPKAFRLSGAAREALNERAVLWTRRCCPHCGTPMRKRHYRCPECHRERETAPQPAVLNVEPAPQDHETAAREAA